MLDLIADAYAHFKSQTFATPEAAIAEANRLAAQLSTADPLGSFSGRTALFYLGFGSGAAAEALAEANPTEYYTITDTERGQFLKGVTPTLQALFPSFANYQAAVERAPGSPW